MSQRCSRCGLVRKANRKAKQYTCRHCKLKLDADINAARNHSQDLEYLSWELRRHIKEKRLNTGNGFFWFSNGFFDCKSGEELAVPLPED